MRSFAGLDDVVFSSVLAPVGKVSIPEPPFYKAFRLLKREKKKVFKLGRSGSSIYVKRKKLKTERGSLFFFFFFFFSFSSFLNEVLFAKLNRLAPLARILLVVVVVKLGWIPKLG